VCVWMSACRNPSAAMIERTYYIIHRQNRNYSVLEHAFSIITVASCFHRYDEKCIRMHTHTYISPLEVVDTTLGIVTTRHTHIHTNT